MESVGAIVACSVAFALSFYLGYGKVQSPGWALPVGAIVGIFFAGLFSLSPSWSER